RAPGEERQRRQDEEGLARTRWEFHGAQCTRTGPELATSSERLGWTRPSALDGERAHDRLAGRPVSLERRGGGRAGDDVAGAAGREGRLHRAVRDGRRGLRSPVGFEDERGVA